MKSWGDLLSIDDQIRGFTDTAGLYSLVKDPDIRVLRCVRGPHPYGIFRLITLTNCESAYTFYGAGYHKNRGYIHNRWVFDLDLEAEPLKLYYNKKSIIVTIARDVSWFKKKQAKDRISSFPLALLLEDDRELGAAMEGAIGTKGSLTAFSTIAFPSPSSNNKGE